MEECPHPGFELTERIHQAEGWTWTPLTIEVTFIKICPLGVRRHGRYAEVSCRMKVLRKGDGQHIQTDFTCNMIYYMIFADMIELYCPRIHCADGKSL